MNSGIIKFFKTIKHENMTIDDVLDAMGYYEPKDREYKQRYISKLMEIESEFLQNKIKDSSKPQQK